MEGTVKWFNTNKGYGFIAGDDGEEYFVHFTAMPRGMRLNENDRVSFEPAETERGKQAKDVQLLGEGSAPAQEETEEQPEEETQEESSEEPEEESSEESTEEPEESPEEEKKEESGEESTEEPKEEEEGSEEEKQESQ